MNCRDIEPLILAEPDGRLSASRQARLNAHLATCAHCQQQRSALLAARIAYQANVNQVPVPEVTESWRDLQARLASPTSKRIKKRPLAPIIWLGSSLAAAAVLALAFISSVNPSSVSKTDLPQKNQIAQADYVEAGDPSATTIVFADQQSGWLVVWASDSKPQT